MAISNPRNLYAGNAVQLDSTPYTNFAINQLAQKQAKKEAVDKYYTDQFSKINGAGLAPEEQEAVLGTKNNMLKYYTQNKDALDKHDVNATTGINQYLSKIQDIIGRGKYKVEQGKANHKIQMSPESAGELTSTAAQNMKNSSAPIYKAGKNGEYELNSYDPQTNPDGYKEFDPNQAMFNAKPYTAPQMLDYSSKNLKNIAPDKVDYQPLMINGKPSTTQMVGVPRFSDKTVASYMDQREGDVAHDDKLLMTVAQGHPFSQNKDEYAGDFNSLNDFYKKYKGKDITTNGQLFAATEGMKLLAPRPTAKPIINQDAKDAQAFQNAWASKDHSLQNSLILQRNSHNLKNQDDGVASAKVWGSISEKIRQMDEATNNGGAYHDENGVKMERTKVATLPDGTKSNYIPFESLTTSSDKAAIKTVLKNAGINYGDDSEFMLVPNNHNLEVFDADPNDGKKATKYRTTITKSDIENVTSKSVKERQKWLKESQPETTPTKVAAPKTVTPTNSNVQVQINGKMYKMPKNSLQKLDKDKVSYKIVK